MYQGRSVPYVLLSKDGVIMCTVTGPRQYSADLAQGGMEVSCNYTFIGEDCTIQKVEKVLTSYTPAGSSQNAWTHLRLRLLSKMQGQTVQVYGYNVIGSRFQWKTETLWEMEMTLLININYSQHLLQKQFPGIGGLKSTLIITKQTYHYDVSKDKHLSRFLQIIHTGNQASNIGDVIDKVTVYEQIH